MPSLLKRKSWVSNAVKTRAVAENVPTSQMSMAYISASEPSIHPTIPLSEPSPMGIWAIEGTSPASSCSSQGFWGGQGLMVNAMLPGEPRLFESATTKGRVRAPDPIPLGTWYAKAKIESPSGSLITWLLLPPIEERSIVTVLAGRLPGVVATSRYTSVLLQLSKVAGLALPTPVGGSTRFGAVTLS